jgi:hypothetical protein
VKWSFQKAIKAENNNKYEKKKNEVNLREPKAFLRGFKGREHFKP